MANEFQHKSVGTDLSQAEYEAVGGHEFNAQATYDTPYASSSTQISRMANNFAASDAPDANDDITAGYIAGSIWVDTTADKAYVCLDNTDGAAVWTEVTQGSSTEATKADMEDEGATNADRFVSPEVAKHSPGVAKVWCHIATAGTLDSPSYNVASITDVGTGDRTVVVDNDFSTDVYSVVSQIDNSTDETRAAIIHTLAVGSFKHFIINTGSLGDLASMVVAFGDQ